MTEPVAVDNALPTDAPRGRAATVGLWILTLAIAFLLSQAGLSKLTAGASWAQRFAGWGLPAALVPLAGLAELVGAIALVVPRTARYGAALLGVTMLVAALTHLANGELARAPIPIVLGALAGLVGWYRRNDTRGR